MSGLLKFNGQVVGVMRYVTAIGNIDRQVLLTVLLVAGVMLAVVGLIVMSSMIFINNVVAPVSAVSEAAKRISGGSYGVQIPNKYSDEMGELVDNINDMSRKIGESERMKSEFISSVSHELRTPLTAINGWGETLLADESNDVQQIKRGVQIMVKESRRLTNMVEELLQFSRLEDGRFSPAGWRTPICRRSWRTRCTAIGSCFVRTALPWSIPVIGRSTARSSPATRNA